MNKIYRVVWSTELGQWVVASEVAKGRKKSASTSRDVLASAALMALVGTVAAPAVFAAGVGNGSLQLCNYDNGKSYGPGGSTTLNCNQPDWNQAFALINSGDGNGAWGLDEQTAGVVGYMNGTLDLFGSAGINMKNSITMSSGKNINMSNGWVYNLHDATLDQDAVTLRQLKAVEAKIPTGSTGGNDANAVHYNTGTNSAKVTLAGTGGTTVTNLKAGTQDTDAVNLGQLKAAGITVDANGTPTNALVAYDSAAKAKVTLGGGVNGTTIANVKDGDTSTGSKEAVNGGQLGLTNQNVTNLQNNYNTLNTTVGSLNDNALKWNGATYSAARQGANRTIDGLSNGTVTATSSDAINGSQLYGTANSVAGALGGGSTVGADGKVGTPTYTVNVQDQRIDSMGAMNSAMSMMSASLAGLHTQDRAAVGTGVVNGEVALSVGYQHAISDSANFTLGGAFTQDDQSVGAAVGFGW